MNNNTFRNNIRRYILGDDEDTGMDIDIDIDKFEITKFDYRSIFGKSEHQNMSHLEMVSKFFRTNKKSEMDMVTLKHKLYFDDHPDEWKELFIFFCVMPFTEYEFQGKDGKLLNPTTLHAIGSSHGTDNVLIETFSELEFESFNEIISEGRLAFNLENILKTDIFSSNFNKDESKRIITNLLFLGLHMKHILVTDVLSTDEDTYKENFKKYLFDPICEYVAALLNFEINIRTKNTAGRTGVNTKVPHQSNDIFHSHPDVVAYYKWKHRRSLAIVEVKKLPILKGEKVVDFTEPRMVSFMIQVVAEMFSDHTNKGMLTDSYTTILIEIDIERSMEIVNQKLTGPENCKFIALNYRLLDCQSSGLTLRGGLISFIYEAFSANEYQLNDVKRGLDAIYDYVRKSDEEYLTYLDGLGEKVDKIFKNNYNSFMRQLHVIEPKIGLGEFKRIDVQSGVTFNSQLFKVNSKDVKMYLKEDIDETVELVVKVFDPAKAKRDHNKYVIKKHDMFDNCRRAYLCEKRAYERLLLNFKFNSVYIAQEPVYGRFFIGNYYHALGPFIVLKYLAKETLPRDEETYEKAKEQLNIIHLYNIIHGDISPRNILYSQGKVYFIDFGYSEYTEDKLGSNPVSANPERIKSEHQQLCGIFGQPTPNEYE
ncbi:DEHA2D00352p [Debaryomyces hansenii CBS767]|uniref:non-specific serine/threonine protein kinase n=1 Tax=Debaryomyces hansenii (strain ATCC 36239 / CBS 767 / BCRC 21394 / JCM 1990 / NBRC 0083 / IGC 2968) TaxID=284592 RepID=Q6BTI4_DEBHA|nr:DEHA2D00352p [Debaryomyces hansenii CBS767]CAG86581.2 DEHA2D00352p [Debaryomyces hansenii CBS767]|eukprot:XP_458485.2 DEHA2D00352p [Debaryomyces hansenii CBS767]